MMKIENNENKIRDLFKVKLYTIRSEKKREKREKRERERERERERHMLTLALTGGS